MSNIYNPKIYKNFIKILQKSKKKMNNTKTYSKFKVCTNARTKKGSR